MAETKPFDRLRIEHRRDGIPHLGKHCAWARMKQQRFVVSYRKLIERSIEVRHDRGNTKHGRRCLRNCRHVNLQVWKKRRCTLPSALRCVNERNFPKILSSFPRVDEVCKKTACPNSTSAAQPSKSIPSAKLA